MRRSCIRIRPRTGRLIAVRTTTRVMEAITAITMKTGLGGGHTAGEGVGRRRADEAKTGAGVVGGVAGILGLLEDIGPWMIMVVGMRETRMKRSRVGVAGVVDL